MKLGMKIGLGNALLLVVMAAAVGVAVGCVLPVRGHSAVMTKEYVPAVKLEAEAENYVRKALAEMAEFSYTGDMRAYEKAQGYFKDLAGRLAAATGQVTLVNASYPDARVTGGKYDGILFSYALSMFNPGWERAIEQAADNLAPGGVIAVVDFHDTAFSLFRKWMWINHVRMKSHLLPLLSGSFEPVSLRTPPAYMGLWRYLIFIGRTRRR